MGAETKAIGKIVRSISFDPEVVQRIEDMRGDVPFSTLVNKILREKLSL